MQNQTPIHTPIHSPIQAFFNQANGTVTSWWSWLAVFWFAVMLWFYGQLIFGIPMMIVGMVVDPSSLEAMMETQASGEATQGVGYLLGLGTVIAGSLAAFLVYVLRNKSSDAASKRNIQIASAFGVLSFAALVYFIMTGSGSEDAALLNGWIAKSALVYMFMLMMFPPMALGLWLGVKHVQKRTILSLHTAHFKFRWGRMVFAMLVVWAIAAISSYGAHVSGLSEATLVFDPSRFWKYLPITLLFIPLQSATEEIALRGYLNQGLGKYIKNPWIVFVITSAAFASLHLSNPEVAETVKEHSIWVAMSGYFFFGLFACVLTYIDGGLEAAIGMHAANNMFAAAIVGYDNSALPVPTIFKVGLNTQLDSIMVIVSLALVCVIMYVTRKPLIRPEPIESAESSVFS